MQTTVVVIGGGATGVGILRDLSMRGIKTILVEQKDLAYGTSSRFHGLLHSGGRYAVKDSESAKECIEENTILRKVARYAVEETEGLFVRLPEDDEQFEVSWVAACAKGGIPALPVTPAEAKRLEPQLTDRIGSAYRVPDSAIDGFRLVWQNVMSARQYGGEVMTYTEVTAIEHKNSQVVGVKVRNTLTGQTNLIACDYIVNAAGSWVGHVAQLAGADVHVKPDRGVLVAFNHRFTSRIVNRLRPAADGDIFVPHGSITIFGTTSSPAERPDDTIPRTAEVMALLKIGQPLFENIYNYRILRVFAGTRPLYSADPNAAGRAASRNFTIIDHEQDGLKGMATIVGGKLTTYRLMAEKMADKVCDKLGVVAACRTAVEPMIADAAAADIAAAKRFFPAYSVTSAVSRLGGKLSEVVKDMEDNPAKRQLLCECEMVTLAEVEAMAADPTSYTLEDVRRKTRIGMGTCQGAFCGFRGVGVAVANELIPAQEAPTFIKDFLEARWNGIRPVLWGNQLREAELMRGIYGASLNIDGAVNYENK
ncbi:Anaerobic glycerol-3-phosphate dehydrogenase subunit A [Sporomusa silvacetica DSM 10669]|uniref:Anaerobic glycerol-3-phosphate dehydrogenase subunit A n=1 Tax=Sporomusa silvacetica DSM 10669 TaxID=1123289 RepID=A0ABZ3IR85_9FIRM|nr:anaerobic glycerol-3-phosphate dehydrogenase subunit GlpA [Sporomusa silvacetica]OZC20428.1 anaerobic glycerol-3-phosphate dehydrogenase subunit A [Sporomusa silvacetica DSM 10669]